jgi:hypothetical protein
MNHTVRFNVPTRELGRADLTFQVRQNGELFGTLAVSNGSLVWFPRDRTYGCKIDWATFDTLMKSNHVGTERRKKRYS